MLTLKGTDIASPEHKWKRYEKDTYRCADL